MFRPLLVSCSTLLAYLPLLCPAQTAHLESDRVFVGDVVTMVIEMKTKYQSLYAIDTTEMEKDFRVLDVKPRASMGSLTEEYRFHATLRIVPRRAGQLEIPSLSVAGRPTPRLVLDVLPLPTHARRAITVRTEASPSNPYVGQQTDVAMRVTHHTPVFDGSWSEPEFEGVEVVYDVKQARSSAIEDGVRVGVVERIMTLFPGSPGELTGSPAGYRARVRVPGDGDTSSTVPGSMRWVFRESEPLQLSVRGIPAASTGGFWLPARELEISQRWGADDELRVGDTLDRVVTIVARGLPGKALPADLLSGGGERFKMYADQATRRDRFDGRTLVGRLDQSYAIVLTRPGKVHIPEVRLKWWDLGEDIEKEAMIEGKTMTVAPALHSQADDEPAQSPQPDLPLHDAPVRSAFLRNPVIPTAVVAVLLIFAVWLLRASNREALHVVVQGYLVRRALRRACLANDPARARSALIRWAQQRWPGTGINGLYQIKAKLHSRELQDELSGIDAVLYSSDRREWQGRRLWRLAVAEQEYSDPDSDRNDPFHPYWPRIFGLDS